MSDKFL